MKKLIFIALFLQTIFANETININSDRTFYKLVEDQIGEFKTFYKLSIAVEITIDEDGEFSYEILNDTDIEGFKDELEKFLEEKTSIKFPTLKGKTTKFKKYFTPKDIVKDDSKNFDKNRFQDNRYESKPDFKRR